MHGTTLTLSTDQSLERLQDIVSEGGPLRDKDITGFDDPSLIDGGSACIWGSVAAEKNTALQRYGRPDGGRSF
jgi:hypothetical protein